MRKLDWSKLKTPKQKLAFLVATAFGAGLAPKAPGTAGTSVGIPLAYVVNKYLPVPAAIAIWTAVLAIGTWGAYVFDRTMETDDNQNIVIDEVLGYGIAMIGGGLAPATLIAAFVLFRFFDIVKLPPVRAVDNWSKKQSGLGYPWFGAFGVMADDLLAGLQSLAVILALQHWGVLPL